MSIFAAPKCQALMPTVPPYRNAPSFSLDSKAGSESGSFHREQEYLVPLQTRTSEHARRPHSLPEVYYSIAAFTS